MSVLDDLEPSFSISLWGYDLRGYDVLEMTARIAEQGGDADLNSKPLWDHPEWCKGWTDGNGRPKELAPHRGLPYCGSWDRNGPHALPSLDLSANAPKEG